MSFLVKDGKILTLNGKTIAVNTSASVTAPGGWQSTPIPNDEYVEQNDPWIPSATACSQQCWDEDQQRKRHSHIKHTHNRRANIGNGSTAFAVELTNEHQWYEQKQCNDGHAKYNGKE